MDRVTPQAERSAGAYRQLGQRRRRLLLALGVTLLLSLFADIALGPGGLSLGQVVNILWQRDSEGTALGLIVWDIRLPIACMALLVGAMLGAAGAQMQTILNNPLADPFTLGISSAASLGAALAIVWGVDGSSLGSELLITLAAFVFSLLTTGALYFFARLRGASAESLVLIGIALLFTFNALLSLLQYTATDVQLSQIVFWMMGSLGRSDWSKVGICALILALVLPLFIYRSWALTAMRMGDDKAASLGIPVRRLRIEVLLAVSLLAATAVAFVGTIAFVGLVAPHLARLMLGEDQRFYLPGTIICGALLMSVASILSKTISSGVVYPVGIITSLIGIPFFISLILGNRRRSWS